jgi:hypothetical protein
VQRRRRRPAHAPTAAPASAVRTSRHVPTPPRCVQRTAAEGECMDQAAEQVLQLAGREERPHYLLGEPTIPTI